MWFSTALGLLSLATFASAAPYNEIYAPWNLNTNQNAQSPLKYDTDYVPDSYFTSPANWRIPFNTVLMDKSANGDPSNDNFFGTMFEWDWREKKVTALNQDFVMDPHVCNVCSIGLCWAYSNLILPSQTALANDIDMAVTDTKTMVAKTRPMVTEMQAVVRTCVGTC